MSALDNLLNGGGTFPGSNNYGSSNTYLNKVYLGAPTETTQTTLGPKGFKVSKLVKNDNTLSIADAKNQFYTWDNKTLNGFVKRLSSYGFENVSRITAKTMWDMAVEGSSQWYSGSNGQQKVTPNQYLQWYSKGKTGSAERLPQKQVYLYDKTAIQGVIDDTLTSVLGRKATADENKQFMAKLKDMVNEGTVTTTSTQVVNGKKMNVTKTTPGFSKERAAASIEEQIKSGTAAQQEDLLQKKSLDFADFLSQLGG